MRRVSMRIMFQVVDDIHFQVIKMINIIYTLILDSKEFFGSFLQGTRGGSTCAKIMSLINEMPANSNQISTNLNLNYKTVIHHLNVLIKNGLIITDDREIYGSTYFLTPLMEQNFQLLEQILEKVRKE